jgi:hypothetical protein
MGMSRALFVAIKTADEPAYRLASKAGMSPGQLSRMMHGAEPVRSDDRRLRRLAKLVGVSPNDVVEPAEA